MAWTMARELNGGSVMPRMSITIPLGGKPWKPPRQMTVGDLAVIVFRHPLLVTGPPGWNQAASSAFWKIIEAGEPAPTFTAGFDDKWEWFGGVFAAGSSDLPADADASATATLYDQVRSS